MIIRCSRYCKTYYILEHGRNMEESFYSETSVPTYRIVYLRRRNSNAAPCFLILLESISFSFSFVSFFNSFYVVGFSFVSVFQQISFALLWYLVFQQLSIPSSDAPCFRRSSTIPPVLSFPLSFTFFLYCLPLLSFLLISS